MSMDDADRIDGKPGDAGPEDAVQRWRVADVEAAIALAQRFKDEGRYQWFRGQVQAWPPHSTLFRRAQQGGQRWIDQDYIPRLSRFERWLRSDPALRPLAEDLDQAFAIAQHHGLPTHCIDFSTDPAVAGFFSADTDTPPPEGTPSCIYCLNLDDLREAWDDDSQAREALGAAPLPPLRFLSPEVPNLWRLQAQRGVFVECGADWDRIYPLDRIEFPYTGLPAHPTREDIYPVRRSQLEQLLDQFFDNEDKLGGETRMQSLIDQLHAMGANLAVLREAREAPPFQPEAFRPGQPQPHPSWQARAPWLALPQEALAEVQQRRAALALDLARFQDDPAGLQRRAQAGIAQALLRQPDVRAHVLHWDLGHAVPGHLQPALNQGLARLWDGLRNLPFSDAQLARALATWVTLAAQGYAQASSGQRAAIAERLFGGPVLALEFSSPDGASSRGLATEAGLRAALRPDLPGLLSDAGLAHAGDLRQLLLVCTDPERLFVFEPLLELFVDQIGPTQLHRQPPSFFHPARLRVLGVP